MHGEESKPSNRRPTDPIEITNHFLRWRKVLRLITFLGLSLLVALIVVDHTGALGRSNDDWSSFNHRQFVVADVLSGDLIRVRSANGTEQIVGLLGIVSPHGDEHWAVESKEYLTNRLAGTTVTLLLELTHTRDADDHLLAYLYQLDVDNLNVDLVKDGMAYSDRRTGATLRPLIDLSETDARKHARGLWKNLTDDQMPAWRRDWLATIKTSRQAKTK